jgi:hypothetical protein
MSLSNCKLSEQTKNAMTMYTHWVHYNVKVNKGIHTRVYPVNLPVLIRPAKVDEFLLEDAKTCIIETPDQVLLVVELGENGATLLKPEKRKKFVYDLCEVTGLKRGDFMGLNVVEYVGETTQEPYVGILSK